MSNNNDMIKLVRLFEATQFAGEPEQKPGDQVRGTDKAESKNKQHPFRDRLVGEEISLEDKLSKRYQDMKDVQSKEKEQKKKQDLDKQAVAEVSGELRNRYVSRASDDYSAANFAARASKSHPGLEKYSKEQEQRAKKRAAGLNRALSDKRLGKEPGVAEGMLDNPSQQDSPVASAIIRRILMQRTDLLSKYGPERVGAAVDEVADFVGDVDEIGSSDVSGWIRHVEQMLGNMDQGVAEAANPTDKITVDVPLMIRIMEYAREDAQDDADLHNVAEQLVRLSAMGKTLGMADYEGIVGVTTEQKLSELGTVPPPGTANSAPTSGSVSPNEQTALNKIQTNPAMKQQFDKLMTQATPGTANKPMALDPAQTDALEKIKNNAGLKGQYDRLIKQANPTATP